MHLSRSMELKVKARMTSIKDGSRFNQVSADGEDAFPLETISINYGTIQWVYTLQKRAGGVAAGNIATGWNREKNSRA
jgi:type VI protein secretion system component Hcp